MLRYISIAFICLFLSACAGFKWSGFGGGSSYFNTEPDLRYTVKDQPGVLSLLAPTGAWEVNGAVEAKGKGGKIKIEEKPVEYDLAFRKLINPAVRYSSWVRVGERIRTLNIPYVRESDHFFESDDNAKIEYFLDQDFEKYKLAMDRYDAFQNYRNNNPKRYNVKREALTLGELRCTRYQRSWNEGPSTYALNHNKQLRGRSHAFVSIDCPFIYEGDLLFLEVRSNVFIRWDEPLKSNQPYGYAHKIDPVRYPGLDVAFNDMNKRLELMLNSLKIHHVDAYAPTIEQINTQKKYAEKVALEKKRIHARALLLLQEQGLLNKNNLITKKAIESPNLLKGKFDASKINDSETEVDFRMLRDKYKEADGRRWQSFMYAWWKHRTPFVDGPDPGWETQLEFYMNIVDNKGDLGVKYPNTFTFGKSDAETVKLYDREIINLRIRKKK